jgi:exopolysaccharide biosynthesis protein
MNVIWRIFVVGGKARLKLRHCDFEYLYTGKRGRVLSKRRIRTILISLVVAATAYCQLAFSEIPAMVAIRELWIETAMTTADHQWLAKFLFPSRVIERTMSRQVMPDDVTNRTDLVAVADRGSDSGNGGGAFAGSAQADRPDGEAGGAGNADYGAGQNNGAYGAGAGAYADGKNAIEFDGAGARGQMGAKGEYERLAGQAGTGAAGADLPAASAAAGAVDALGNKVLASDEEQGVRVVEVRGATYVGRILFVADPSRVVVKHTSQRGAIGQLIGDYAKQHGAIAGINGNGFDDPEGHGKGGSIIGWSVSGGEEWGSGARDEYSAAGFNDDDVLVVGKISDFKKYGIRDMVQYGPALIVDGKLLIKGSAGWGLQPRTAIGQLRDGTVMLATFDGRQPGHSMGITAGDLADILYEYGCVNAGLCDGGSSSVMMYDGKIIGSPSTPMKDTGRYLPNAILVLRR